MPQTKSAKKALRNSIRNRGNNLHYTARIKDLKRKIRKLDPEKDKAELKKQISLYYSAVDKAVKKNIFHKNKGGHLKSQILKAPVKLIVKAKTKVKKAKKKAKGK
jgi:small subunit ribosomal protein S20